MRVALVVIAGCSTPLAPHAPVANSEPALAPSVFDVPIEPATFHYCCKGGGNLEKSVTLPEGRYLLRVGQQSDECYEAVHPTIMAGDTWLSTGVASTPEWATTLVEVPAALADQPLRLRVFVEGGLHCCGTTTIDKIQLVSL